MVFVVTAAVATVAMLRRKTLRVRPAAMAALVLATMGTAARVNGWSEQWMYYDTASSATVFFYQHRSSHRFASSNRVCLLPNKGN